MTINPINQLPPEVGEAFEAGWRAFDKARKSPHTMSLKAELEQFARDYHEAHRPSVTLAVDGPVEVICQGNNWRSPIHQYKEGAVCACGFWTLFNAWDEGKTWRRVPKSPDNGGAK